MDSLAGFRSLVSKSKASIYIVVVGLFLFFLWVFWLGPWLKKLPDNFSYSAQILSLDNFYDEKLRKYEGEHISKTTFRYFVTEVTPQFLILKNEFSVYQENDKPIFSVARLYHINPYNWQHVPEQQGNYRKGYLFGPRYANQDSFYYWHVNYDAPALLKFIHEEKIDGLSVYHYQAQYSADQTVNLTSLPGVPQKRGIRADIVLDLWIEPISGWLVQYQDHTLASYYDRKTKLPLSPWNKFSNRYTQSSIQEQVRQAFLWKWRILIIDFVVPFLIIVVSLFILFDTYVREWALRGKQSLKRVRDPILKNKKIAFAAFGCVVAIIILFIYSHQPTPQPTAIGISSWSDNPEYLDIVRGFKDELAQEGFKEGENITFLQRDPHQLVEYQIKIIQKFAKRDVKLIFTLTTPGTLIAKGVVTQVPIIFALVSYPVEVSLIHSLGSSENNLVGIRNYIQPAEQFLRLAWVKHNIKTIGFVHRKGEPNTEIQFQEFKTMLAARGISIIDIAGIDIYDLLQNLETNRRQVDALYLACDDFMEENGGSVAVQFANPNKIPTLSCGKDAIVQGALIGYVPDYYLQGRLAGRKAAAVLRGANPSWLKTETLTKGTLIINLGTARLLGISIPDDILEQADLIIDQK